MSSRSIVLVLAFVALAVGQPQLQTTPQQVITSLVSQQAQLSANIISTLNQVPELLAKIEAQQKQIAELTAQLDAFKAAQKKEKK
jgi:cell shape-determining protein MreC